RPLFPQLLEPLPRGEEDLARRARLEHVPAEHLDERQERRALAVGHAAADEHGHLLAEQGNELPREPGLADPRLAEQCEGDAAPLAEARLGRAPRPRQPGPPPDGGRVDPPREARRTFGHLVHAEGERVSTLRRARPYGVPYEPLRRRADQDIAAARRLLQPL